MNNYFDQSFKELVLDEGGWVNDPDDSGGETYLGVTRRDHPNAKFWAIIDAIKKASGTKDINIKLKGIPAVIDEIKKIYKQSYWDPIQLDQLSSKGLAHQIFDHAVNAGVGAAIGLAQELVGMKVTNRYTNDLLIKLKEYGKV